MSATDAGTRKGANLEGASLILKLESFKSETPEKGFRLCRIISKPDKAGNSRLPESLGTIIPELSFSEVLNGKFPALYDLVRNALHDVQDSVVKDAAIRGERQIWHKALNLEACEAYVASNNATLGALSLDDCAAFFKATSPALLAAYCTLRGIDNIDEKKAKEVSNVLGEILKGFATAKPVFSPNQEQLLSLAFAEVPAEVANVERFRNKLEAAVARRKEQDTVLSI